ncbi:ethanolamine utilization protein EutH [Bacillus sp. Marseille-P3661]|uniref:ethanolamine utilization protein EutH n=1 Tax=Bacillus sp. Marseille-P3661 TaxID=1936234 RepID=UPI000C86208C|nr:ethanolamine utilization protein EutH [Bacillus sp. Marseille-P3661]
MGINTFVIYLMVFFLCLGALDKCLGNRWGFGQRFTDGFMAMGPLTLAMVGIVSIAPVLADVLIPIIAPLYEFIGADPASFANTLLAVDMGGYALAQEMAIDPDAALFSWVFLGTMMGPTIVFTIPVALGIIDKQDQPYFANGILLGIITVPLGCLVGGMFAGFNLKMIVINLIPMMIASVLIGVGILKFQNLMIIGFQLFGKVVEIIAVIGLTAIIVETLTGFTIIKNMAPIEEGIQIVGMIAIMLAGAFPMVSFISFAFKKHLTKFGSILNINNTSTAGLIASLAHVIPMFSMFRDMEPKGKVINTAFAVSGAFVFGGHLGFVAGMNKEMAFAMIIGKLISGITAVLLAVVTLNRKDITK